MQDSCSDQPVDQAVSFSMLQSSWESENGTPTTLHFGPPLSPPLPALGDPPPPAHHHQTPAAGSLPHLTPSSTRWAWVITGAQHHPWPPHLPPSLVELPHLGPCDGALPGGCLLTSQNSSKAVREVGRRSRCLRLESPVEAQLSWPPNFYACRKCCASLLNAFILITDV